jgi:hypothetical protein
MKTMFPTFQNRYRSFIPHCINFFSLFLFVTAVATAGERSIVQLRDLEQTEVKSAGFILPSDMQVHIQALGCGSDKGLKFSDDPMCAYGWIINADTREVVWEMSMSNTHREKDDRACDDQLTLPKGSYEVYFAAYAYYSNSPFFSYNINIDRRKDLTEEDKPHKRGFFSWLDDLFNGDVHKEWRSHAKRWGIELFISDPTAPITSFNPPKNFNGTLFHAVRLGENEHLRQGFTITKPMEVRIYAIGEQTPGSDPADYGWIIDAKSRKRIWEMTGHRLVNAGGAEKNVKFDGTITFEPGDYLLYYITDDSHSFVDWNAAPPSDPFNYGVTLIATGESEASSFTLSTPKEDQNVIVQLTRVGNNETRNESFLLKKDARLHIYAIGERGNSHRQMADYGWIINTKSREKVWTMDIDRTEHAGGDEKNRMIDEIIPLPKGTYSVYYQTDDSHAYNDWNSSPPFDPEHYGITVSLEGEMVSTSIVEKKITPNEEGVLAQITRVGDNANLTRSFHLDKPTHVQVYAIGEGQGHEMFDYGWIENVSSGSIVWEMSYGMTFHAGGARKNRMVKTTILLDKGEYRLHYVSDDSHSYNNWNSDPPEDPTMWGITLYEEK